MTVVEFFDESQTENITGLLCEKYSQVIYIGSFDVMTESAVLRIKEFVAERYPTVEITFVHTKSDTVADICVALTKIVLQNKDCVFEATGGSDAGLIALGIISERYGVNIVRTDFKDESEFVERLSVFETIELGGGILEGYEQNSFNINPQLRRDVSVMWRMGTEDCEYWIKGGRFLSTLQSDINGLEVYSSRKINQKQKDFLYDLQSCGFIKNLDMSSGKLKFSYRDEEIWRVLVKSGNLLELTTFFAVLSRIPCSDAHRGVQLVWRPINNEERNKVGSCEIVRNEIDVIFMNGICPVFVSCKAGNVDKEALYELETVAERFGGKYARKILVTGCLAQNNKNPAQFVERARNMGITVIDNVYKMTADRLGNELAKGAVI